MAPPHRALGRRGSDVPAMCCGDVRPRYRGAEWRPGLLRLTPPHPHPLTSEIFSAGKNQIHKKGPTLVVNFRYTKFFFGV